MFIEQERARQLHRALDKLSDRDKAVMLALYDGASEVELAEEMQMTLTVHAPYFVNLNSEDPEKLAASKMRILKALTMAQLAGARGAPATQVDQVRAAGTDFLRGAAFAAGGNAMAGTACSPWRDCFIEAISRPSDSRSILALRHFGNISFSSSST